MHDPLEQLVLDMIEFDNMYINIADSQETLDDKAEHYRER